MSKLVPPHGGKGLVCCLLEGAALEEELKKAAGLKQIEISSRAKGDLIMMGIGGFSPLNGFMNKADWKSVCEKMLLSDGTFWPVPVTLDVSADDAKALKVGEEGPQGSGDGHHEGGRHLRNDRSRQEVGMRTGVQGLRS